MGEGTPDSDEVVRGVELEEERLAECQCGEAAVPSRLPEIDLVEFTLGLKKSEPVSVCDSDKGFHLVRLDNSREYLVNQAGDVRGIEAASGLVASLDQGSF